MFLFFFPVSADGGQGSEVAGVLVVLRGQSSHHDVAAAVQGQVV